MLSFTTPQSRCLVGVSRQDITPPVGIYHRMWGAAAHDQSTGIHQPLTLTTLGIADIATADARPYFMVAMDHCLLWPTEMDEFLQRVATETGVEQARITVFFSHTHAAGLVDKSRTDLAGGEFIEPYFDDLVSKTCQSIGEAKSSMQNASITYATGHCNLATNRDLWDSDRGEYVCGFNPEGLADDSVLVARMTGTASGEVIATLVNYACHPTTLAWDNTLISPDYVGSMRDVVESNTNAPCFFIQGASGDIGPRNGFVGDAGVAEQNGRQLGFAAISTLESFLTSDHHLTYSGAVVSGATIGTWREEHVDAQRASNLEEFNVKRSKVLFEYRDDLPDAESNRKERNQLEEAERVARSEGNDLAASEARARIERIDRRSAHMPISAGENDYEYQFTMWRLGDAIWIALNGEPYNKLQREVRKRFPEWTIIIGTIANGSKAWYFPDSDSFGKGLYQEAASILKQGSLEKLIDSICTEIAELTA